MLEDTGSLCADFLCTDRAGNVGLVNLQLSAVALPNQIADVFGVVGAAVHHRQKNPFNPQFRVDLPLDLVDGSKQLFQTLCRKVCCLNRYQHIVGSCQRIDGQHTIILTGKGGKSRIVPVMKPTGELLKQYMEGSGLTSPVYGRNPLFTNRGNKPLTRAGVTYILKKYAAQAQAMGVKDISDEITPHWLRHSKAMHLLQSGVNLVYIRDLLGHSDISTTEIYARADEKMKRKALMEAYNSPASDELPTWKKDKDLLDWLKSL